MDPLCHTFVGSTLAGTRLGRSTWGATATLLVAANLPDLDVLSYLRGGDAALGFRRGWTHGVLAQAILPLLLAAAIVAIGRWRQAAPRPWRVLGLSCLGLLTHPLLDWMNTYGLRWWMPFDGRWYYADALFIVDPWLWLLLGGATFLAWSQEPRVIYRWAALAALTSLPILGSTMLPMATRVGWCAGLLLLGSWRGLRGPLVAATRSRAATVALLLAFGYVAMAASLGAAARQAARTALGASAAGSSSEVLAAPRVGNPFAWDLLVVEPGRYRTGRYQVGSGSAGVTFDAPRIDVGDADPRVAVALEAPCVQGMRGWLRYPFFVVDEGPSTTAVHILDARYTRRVTRGFGGAVVRLDRQGRVVGCD